MIARITFMGCLLLTAVSLAEEIVEIPLPEGASGVSAIQYLPGRTAADPALIALATQTGGIYLGEAGETVTWRAFSTSGLDRPCGLYPGDEPGELYVLQRPELSLLKDYDDDGRADLYRMVNRSWALMGDARSGATALAVDPSGRWLVALSAGPSPVPPISGGEGPPDNPTALYPVRPQTDWSGAAVISPTEGHIVELGTSGELTPRVSNVGAVQAIELQEGGKLAVVSNFGPGGSPSLHFLQLPPLVVPEEGEEDKPAAPVALPAPAIVIPESLGATGEMGNPISIDGQWLIGGVAKGLLRVLPDPVGEGGEQVMQGAVTDYFSESEALQQVTRLAKGSDGASFLAGTAAGKLYRVPAGSDAGFIVTGVHLGSDGFELSFSDEVTRAPATEPVNYSVKRIDGDTPGPVAVTQAVVEPDGKRVTLKLPMTLIPEGSVWEIELKNLTTALDESALAHGPLFYTLNRLSPAAEKPAWTEE